MPFKPGQPKPPGSGRKPGVRNHGVVPKIDQVLIDRKINPLLEILRLLPELEDREQADVWIKLLPYIYPKKKDVEAPPADPSRDVTPIQDVDSDSLLAALDGTKTKPAGNSEK